MVNLVDRVDPVELLPSVSSPLASCDAHIEGTRTRLASDLSWESAVSQTAGMTARLVYPSQDNMDQTPGSTQSLLDVEQSAVTTPSE